MNIFKLTAGILTIGLFGSQLQAEKLRGRVKLDGSSTVFPVAEAVAEEFQKVHPRVQVTVGLSGTGGGFSKFVNGETDISNASREIKGKEVKLAEKNKIRYFEIPVAFDGISVVVHKDNNFARKMTLQELEKAWAPKGSNKATVKKWNEVNPKWPATAFSLYGPGPDSGTFDFFTEEVMGKSGLLRSDFTASEDDNALVTGVSRSKGSMGYFGYAYYVANKSKLGLVAIAKKAGEPYIAPSIETIKDSSYPLARPLLMYVNLEAAKKKEVKAFIEFFIQNAGKLSAEVGYVALPAETYKKVLADFRSELKKSLSH